MTSTQLEIDINAVNHDGLKKFFNRIGLEFNPYYLKNMNNISSRINDNKKLTLFIQISDIHNGIIDTKKLDQFLYNSNINLILVPRFTKYIDYSDITDNDIVSQFKQRDKIIKYSSHKIHKKIDEFMIIQIDPNNQPLSDNCLINSYGITSPDQICNIENDEHAYILTQSYYIIQNNMKNFFELIKNNQIKKNLVECYFWIILRDEAAKQLSLSNKHFQKAHNLYNDKLKRFI